MELYSNINVHIFTINIHELKTKENQNENFLNLKGFPHSYVCRPLNVIEQTIEWLCYWKLIKNANFLSWFCQTII